MAIPNRSFRRYNGGKSASLKLEKLAMPDTLFFANNVSLAATVDVDVKWEATSDFAKYGGGSSAPADDPSAFEGKFAEAKCAGKISGVETGFWFRSGQLSSDTFYADMGWEKNGVYL